MDAFDYALFVEMKQTKHRRFPTCCRGSYIEEVAVVDTRAMLQDFGR